jgi:hypothetical protein
MAVHSTLMRSLIAARICWRLCWQKSEIMCILTDLLGGGNALIWEKVIRIPGQSPRVVLFASGACGRLASTENVTSSPSNAE